MEVRIKVKTGAPKEGVVHLRDGRLEVSVRAQPEAGKANERVIELVARHLNVVPDAVRIMKGQTRPTKVLNVSMT